MQHYPLPSFRFGKRIIQINNQNFHQFFRKHVLLCLTSFQVLGVAATALLTSLRNLLKSAL